MASKGSTKNSHPWATQTLNLSGGESERTSQKEYKKKGII